jgi:hypothetical protein
MGTYWKLTLSEKSATFVYIPGLTKSLKKRLRGDLLRGLSVGNSYECILKFLREGVQIWWLVRIIKFCFSG